MHILTSFRRSLLLLISFIGIGLLLSSCASTAPVAFTDSVDDIMKEFNRSDVPGASILVMRNDSILLQRSYGLADLRTKEPVVPTTNFRLASMTKQFTAMCILLLSQDGLISLDAPLSRYFNELPSWGDSVTVFHLLTHTSGIVDYESLIPDTQTVQVHDADVLSLVSRVDTTYFSVGTQYSYSNSGYALLALLVERTSNERFADFLQKRIFSVVGMQSSVAYENGISDVPHRAYGHSPAGNAWTVTDQSNTSAVLGDGGIYSNVVDLARWYSALFSYSLIPESLQRRAWSPAALNDGTLIDYGFGWHLETDHGILHPSHGGSTIGFRNNVQVFPDDRTVVVVLTNRNSSVPSDLAHRIFNVMNRDQ